LLSNEGGGRFAGHTAVIQADVSLPNLGGGQLFGDYDNDGDLDLFVPLGNFSSLERNVLLRNDRGVFRDVAVEAGLTTGAASDNAMWLDYDRDGFIDLYVANIRQLSNIRQPSNQLYRNKGDGAFWSGWAQSGGFAGDPLALRTGGHTQGYCGGSEDPRFRRSGSIPRNPSVFLGTQPAGFLCSWRSAECGGYSAAGVGK